MPRRRPRGLRINGPQIAGQASCRDGRQRQPGDAVPGGSKRLRFTRPNAGLPGNYIAANDLGVLRRAQERLRRGRPACAGAQRERLPHRGEPQELERRLPPPWRRGLPSSRPTMPNRPRLPKPPGKGAEAFRRPARSSGSGPRPCPAASGAVGGRASYTRPRQRLPRKCRRQPTLRQANCRRCPLRPFTANEP